MNQHICHVHIITGGETPEENQLMSHLSFLSPPSCIIAADSGLDTARRYGIMPNIILGDMDSVSSKELLSLYKENNVKIYHSDKDYTDTELAVIEARKHADGKESVITIAGADGGRIDHLLAVRTLYDRNLAPDIWICKTQAVYFLTAEPAGAEEFDTAAASKQTPNGGGKRTARSSLSFTDINPNDYISVFPVELNAGVKGLSAVSSSLKWPLQNVDWDGGQISISNKIDEAEYKKNGSTITAAAVKGSFLAVIPLTAKVTFYGNPSC